jgi:hypothetical protein
MVGSGRTPSDRDVLGGEREREEANEDLIEVAV